MGKKKTQTNTYQQLPVTPQVQQLQTMVNRGSDPSIPYAYAQRRQDVQNSYQNPLGAYTTPAVKDASERVANERLSMDEAAAIAASNYNAQQQAFGQQATVAGLTQPVMTSSTTSQPFNWGSVIGAGAQVGAAALTLCIYVLINELT